VAKLTWTARNNVQRGPSCGDDPALPVGAALTKTTEKNRSSDFSR
jgi:hypothetical protein